MKLRMRLVLIAIILILMVCLAWGQDSLTFEQAVRIGLEHNLDLKATRLRRIQAERAFHPGPAGFLPALNLNASHAEIRDNLFKSASSSGTSINYGAELNWTLFDGSAMFIQYRILKIRKDLMLVEEHGQWASFLFNLHSAFNELARQQSQLILYREVSQLSKFRLETVTINLKTGAASQVDLLKSRVEYNSRESQRKQQELSLRDAYRKINLLIGIAVDSMISVIDPFPVSDTQTTAWNIESREWENYPALQSAALKQQIAQYQIRYSAAQWFPKIVLSALYGRLNTYRRLGSFEEKSSQSYQVNTSIQFNLFNGFKDCIEYRNTRSEREIAELEYIKEEREVKSLWRQSLEDYSLYRELVSNEEENLEIAATALKLARQRYELGAASLLEWMESQNYYTQAADRLIEIRFQLRNSENTLKLLSGRYNSSYNN